MKCPNCDNIIPDGSIFCNHCGQRIEEHSGIICTNPQCGKKIPSDSNFCPFCGESLATTSANSHGLVFPDFTIVLGDTTIPELIDISEEKGINYECIGHYERAVEYEFASGVRVHAKSMNSPIFMIRTEDYTQNPTLWKQIIPIDEWSTRNLASYCRKLNLQFRFTPDNIGILIMLSKERSVLTFGEGAIIILMLLSCPKCGGKDLQLEEIELDDILSVRCKSCKNKFDMLEIYSHLNVCPNCGSTDITDDGSGNIQFSCNKCGYVWGDEEENTDDKDNEEYDEDDIQSFLNDEKNMESEIIIYTDGDNCAICELGGCHYAVGLERGKNAISVQAYPWIKNGFVFACQYQEEIKSLDLSRFDTSNLKETTHMFEGCSSLESLDLSYFDTSNIKYMSYMFKGCHSLTSLDLSRFDTSNVKDMSHMFEGCHSLTSLDLSYFDTSNVEYLNSMFKDCYSLTSLDLSGFDTTLVLTQTCMFDGCESLKYIRVTNCNNRTTQMIRQALNESGLSHVSII